MVSGLDRTTRSGSIKDIRYTATCTFFTAATKSRSYSFKYFLVPCRTLSLVNEAFDEEYARRWAEERGGKRRLQVGLNFGIGKEPKIYCFDDNGGCQSWRMVDVLFWVILNAQL